MEGFTQIGVGVGSEGAENLTIRNSVIVGGTLGVRVFQGAGPDQVSLDHVTIQGATSSAVFSREGKVDISNSIITDGYLGIEADTSATINVESSMLTFNTYAVCIYTGSTARLSRTDIYDNGTGIESCGGTVLGASNSGPSLGLPKATPPPAPPPNDH
jgi:hypothetical protein